MAIADMRVDPLSSSDDWLEKFRLLMHEKRAFGSAIYRLPADSRQLRVWRTLSPHPDASREHHREIADSLIERAQFCFDQDIDRLMHPRVPDQVYGDGWAKYGFVIGSGAVRAAGYAIAVVLPAQSEAEVQAVVTAVHAMIHCDA